MVEESCLVLEVLVMWKVENMIHHRLRFTYVLELSLGADAASLVVASDACMT